MNSIPVLIIGAGPTGLVLALWLTQAGIQVRIIDKNSGPGQASRAMVVQARTLEFYQQLGIADLVVAQGIQIQGIKVKQHGQIVVDSILGNFGQGLSPYPFVLSFPQDEHEKLLYQALQQLGVQVEWQTELKSFSQTDNAVQAVLQHAQGETQLTCDFLCGCDGASSTVRQQLGLGFAGGTYTQRFFVADVKVSTPSTADIMPCLDKDNFCIAFPLRHAGMMRLLGIVPPIFETNPEISFTDLQAPLQTLTGIVVEHCDWFSIYHVHHRVAEHFQQGRIFIAGDAGHIHSPAGGQGMNTGISDAVNLAWKLAEVLKAKADKRLLDSFDFLPFLKEGDSSFIENRTTTPKCYRH